jgi:hypothetical protein
MANIPVRDEGDSPAEKPAVRTTIVGGRPPGCGKAVGKIPGGVEVLMKKAAVDEEFRALLLDRREAAAAEIGLKLEAAEEAMLRAAPAAQIEAIVDHTRVEPGHRKALLSWSAAVIVAALGIAVAGCFPPVAGGARPDVPEIEGPTTAESEPETGAPPTGEEGEGVAEDEQATADDGRDDLVTRGVRPDRP